MKVKELIQFIDEIKPNAFTNEVKVMWLNEVEGMIQTDILLFAPVEVIRYNWDKHQETELLVNAPHDKLYRSYLAAMIDFANGEADNYANGHAMFNAQYDEFKKWYIVHYRPADNYARGDYL